MRYNEKRKSRFNVWTVFTDMAICFLIIILLVFIANTIKLKKTLEEKIKLAAFAEAALNDTSELINELQKDKDLKQMIKTLPNPHNQAIKDTIIIFSNDLLWKINRQHKVQDLGENGVKIIDSFGKKLKTFLDNPDSKNSNLKRYDTYTVLIIGHANTDGKSESNYELSIKRAEAVRTELFKNNFKGGEDKYKILATGVGDKHLVKLKSSKEDEEKGARCVEIVFKYDEMDMIKGLKN
ncbi:MAG: OmpA family protein [Candidatus Cloacimonetes bacterium]|nr:OmpA family protein [Candidatus Cloacimonadota bacterium]